MAKFFCKNCGYRFERERRLEKCPYCNKEGSITKEQNAEELINELSDFE